MHATYPPLLTPRHPTWELRGLQFENRDGDARRLALIAVEIAEFGFT